MAGSGFERSRRLLNAADYSYVFDNASFKVSHKHYLILARRNNRFSHSRLGLVVSKKNARLATRRNRIKRVVRETFRINQHCLTCLDIVFLVRQGFDTLPSAQQTRLMEEAWKKLARYSGVTQ
jgi:ribonuclease P protein component